MTDPQPIEQEELSAEQEEELRVDLQRLLGEHDVTLAKKSDATATVDLDQPIGRLSRMDAIQQQKMAVEQRRRIELRRGQLRQALGWMEDGDYGCCRRCEEPIGFRRLKARPESAFCLGCRSSIETGGA
jgi:DnaK suppressor protein